MKTLRRIARESVIFTLLGPIVTALGFIGVQIYNGRSATALYANSTSSTITLTSEASAKLDDTVIFCLSSGHSATLPRSSVPALLKQDPGAKFVGPLAQFVLMIAPDGQEKAFVPVDKAAEAYRVRGAEFAVDMTGPDGSKAVIPFSLQGVNQQNGATWDDDADNASLKRYLVSQEKLTNRLRAIWSNAHLSNAIEFALVYGWVIGLSVWCFYRVVRFAVKG